MIGLYDIYDDFVSTMNPTMELEKWKDRKRASELSARPLPATGLDRNRCVAYHEHLRHHYGLYMSTQLPSSVSSMPEESPKASAPLSSLKVITLSELTLNNRHDGRVLYGQLCVKPFKVSSVNTVLEDTTGSLGVAVITYNVLSSTASIQEIEERFPVGMTVAIKEPFFKLCCDGKFAVRVDNPADICTFENDVYSQGDEVPLDSGDPNTSPITFEILETLRSEGNDLFRQQDWIGAAYKYSQCISQASRQEIQNMQMESNRDEEKLNRTVMWAYSNRAEAKLRLQAYEHALSDVDKALEFNPKDVKTIFRKGKAAHGLGLFDQACEMFRAALEQSPHEQAILESLQASKLANEQSRTGHFDLTDYYSRGCMGDAPSCADFVGPVEIRRVTYGCGNRGLFATRAVKEGKVLLVSNPLATVWQNEDINQPKVSPETKDPQRITSNGARTDSGDQEDLVAELANRVMTSKRQLAQLYSLTIHEQRDMDVPSMKLFRPGSEWVPDDTDKLHADIGRIREIAKSNAFGSIFNGNEYMIPVREQKDQGHQTEEFSCGLWVLPSFANHSCAPNCLVVVIGEAVFFRAARNIREGEELTITYLGEIILGLDARQALLKNWLFTCKCERCLLEESLMPQLSKVSNYKDLSRLVDAADEERDRGCHNGRAVNQLAAIADKVEAVLHLYTFECRQQSWIRVPFLEAYRAKHELAVREHSNNHKLILSVGLKIEDAAASVCVHPIRHMLQQPSVMREAT